MVKTAQEKQTGTSTQELKSVSDYMPERGFYPDLPKVKLADILGKALVIRDATIIENFESQFGIHPFAILMLEDPENGTMSTVGTSAIVVLKKVRSLLAYKFLPCMVTFSKPGAYYDMA